MRTALLALLATPLLATTLPAHAAGGWVETSYVANVTTVNGVRVVVAECDATAQMGPDGDAAALTSVTCDVNNGTVIVAGQPTSATAPGSKAAVVVVTQVSGSGPVTLCISGSAFFYDFVNNRTYTAYTGPTCTVIAS